MKKLILVGYVMMAAVTLFLQSCQEDLIVPNGTGNDADTTWVLDTIGYNGGGNGNPIDSTNWGGGNGDPVDSTNWDGGDGNPGDSL